MESLINFIDSSFNFIKYYYYKVFLKIKRNAYYLLFKVNSLFRSTFNYKSTSNSLKLINHFDFLSKKFFDDIASNFPEFISLIKADSRQIISHSFNLLGSTQVIIKHGMICKGLDGYKYDFADKINPDKTGKWLEFALNKENVLIAKNLWSQLSPKYLPIDWQIDFKSGYRWSEREPYYKIKIDNLPGVDIKVPWELSRMQHLPLLALSYGFAKHGILGELNQDDYYLEIRNQFFDFMATNPPGYGVNWICAMDVAIRLVNVLVAYDILKSSGASIDEIFEKNLILFVGTHAKHIHNNLEWHPKYRGNHYLSNIAGLIFAGAYLSGNQANKWFQFGVKELISETLYQFNVDGSNFEGSTCYHRLSAEIVLWSTAIILKNNYFENTDSSFLDIKIFPLDFWSRLSGMANFTEAITKPNGMVVQFGDNDSGRFISFGSGEKVRALENIYSPFLYLDHRGLVAGINALLGKDDPNYNLDIASVFIKNLRKSTSEIKIHQDKLACDVVSKEGVWNYFQNLQKLLPEKNKWITEFQFEPADSLNNNLSIYQFFGFGCYVFKSKNIFLAVRCGSIGLVGLGAHDHYDQLSIELFINGKQVLSDPGSFIYTPLVYKRNLYRSFEAHNGPKFVGIEKYCKPSGMFDLRGSYPAIPLYADQNGFIGRWNIEGFNIYRMIAIENTKIIIIDFTEESLELKNPILCNVQFSQGYGLLMA